MTVILMGSPEAYSKPHMPTLYGSTKEGQHRKVPMMYLQEFEGSYL